MKSMSNWLLYGGAPDDFGYNNTDISMYPSSNDTHLMVTKPMLVNLGSKSSKCTEIKTPMDPAKMRFIDNKRMSIIIGCTAGILVFIFIIIRYVICILAWNISKNTLENVDKKVRGSHLQFEKKIYYRIDICNLCGLCELMEPKNAKNLKFEHVS